MSVGIPESAQNIRNVCQCKYVNFSVVGKALEEATRDDVNLVHMGHSPLVLAVLSPSSEDDAERLVQLLLDHGAAPDLDVASEMEALSPLMAALSVGRLRCAERLVAAGAAVDSPTMWKRRPFDAACLHGSREGVAFLVRHGLDVGKHLATMLETAAGRSAELVRLLMEEARAASADIHGDMAVQALCNAAQSGNSEAVAALVEAGADLNRRAPRDGMTPLLYALRAGRGEQARQLLQCGADATVKSSTDVSALQLAVDMGDQEVVQCVLESARDAVTATELSSAVVLATRRRKRDVVEALLAHGVDATYPDRIGRYPLHEAVRACACDIVPVLLAAGAYVDARDRAGQSPLHIYAEWKKVPDSIGLCLLRAGASTSLQDRYERTPLHYAAARDHTSAIEHLLRHGAPVDARDMYSLVPLFQAVRKNFSDAAMRLIEARADVNVPGRGGARLLDISPPDIIPALLHAGAVLGSAASRPKYLYDEIKSYEPSWTTSNHGTLAPALREVIELVVHIHSAPGCCSGDSMLTLIPTELLHMIFEDVVVQENTERVAEMLKALSGAHSGMAEEAE